MHALAMAYVWGSEDTFQELVLSFYSMNFKDPTQVIGVGSKHLYLLSAY